MEKLNPWKFGAVLSLAVGINYVLCSIVWMTWTERSIDFLSALFHGLDFHKLQVVGTFSLSSFVYALAAFMIWVYAIGAIYALIRNWLQPHVDK